MSSQAFTTCVGPSASPAALGGALLRPRRITKRLLVGSVRRMSHSRYECSLDIERLLRTVSDTER